VIGLVWARARRRRSAAALVGLAVAGSVVVLGSLFGVGIVTEDLATRRALADLSPTDRTISLHRSTTDGLRDAEDDRAARDALQPVLDVTGPILALRIYQPTTEWFRVLAVDDIGRAVVVTKGRLPAPCAMGSTCEAVRMGPELPNGIADVGTTVELAGTQIEIVGIAQAVPDLPIQVIGLDAAVLVVDGFSTIHESPALAEVGRTNYWFAPIDATAAHSWTLADLGARVDTVDRTLGRASATFVFSTPEDALRTVHQRTEVALGRLVFISSLILGVLLAFAAFAAAIERADVGLEDRRLRAAGASRPGRFLFVAVEAIVPAVAGAVVGTLGSVLVIGALAASQGLPVGTVLGLALLQPAGVALTLALVGLAIVATILGMHPSTGRMLQPRVVIAAVLPAGLILVWQRISAGPVDPARLAAEATSPASVLLPGTLGLSVILGSLVVLPPMLRWLARRTQRAPTAVRLATISLAREPLRPAAIMTLLAFSVGAVVFGQTYATTLRQGAIDQAAFAAGMDLRVQGLAAEVPFSLFVVPQLQAGKLGSDIDVQPMMRLPGETATHNAFTLVGFDGSAIDRLKGWRRDFSPSDPATLGAAIHLDGSWVMAGHVLSGNPADVAIDVDYAGDPIKVSVVIEDPLGGTQFIEAGTLAPGHQVLRVQLGQAFGLELLEPGQPITWRVLGLIVQNGGNAGEGGPDEGRRQQGEITVRGMPELFDAGAPIQVEVAGLSPVFLGAPAPTDGLVLPAIVSPDLASDVDAAGVIDITIGQGLRLRVRPVGTTTRFPSIQDPGPVVVVDYAPLRLAINTRAPGSGQPNQVLVGTPSDVRTAEVVTALRQGLFPPLVMVSRAEVEAARTSDPFAIGVVWGLVVGAIAGLLLSIVGVLLATASELRDERGELWELEAQGTTPRALGRLVVGRTLSMCAVGTVAGVAMGVALGWFVATSVGVGADGSAPNPPLQLVAPWLLIALAAAALLLVVVVAVYALARRHFARTSLGAGVR
jgi:FtsX-like permease family